MNKYDEQESIQSKIANRLADGKGITQLWALKKLGCMRLAVVINRLRNKGYQIKTEMVSHAGKTFARYTMEL